MANLDSRELRSAFGYFATGVTIITGRAADDAPVGITSNSFTSVSLDPPLVLWSLAKTSRSFAAFEQAKTFVVHVLAREQQDLSALFSSKSDDKFSPISSKIGETSSGDPMIEGCLATFECETFSVNEGGDHILIIGKVIKFEYSRRDPIIFFKGRYSFLQDI
jgi:3-hydroxy-9,10-secoandrosta-1,3,5(10)-triene-9,17-dione monooxygenase reductase component